MIEVVERRARVGLELVDAITGGPIIGASRVVVGGADIDVRRANRARWLVENVSLPLMTFVVDAEHYVTETIDVMTPPEADPGVLVEVVLTPRTGYPFAASLTRVVGQVVIDATGLPASGADVTVTPARGGSPGTPLATRSTDDGQYVMWFLPDPAASPPIADRYRVDAQLPDGGITLSGSLSLRPLQAGRRNDAPVLRLFP